MAKEGKTNKRSFGSVRAKAGLTAKAGRRRQGALVSEVDTYGKRQWMPASGAAGKSILAARAAAEMARSNGR